MNKSFTRWLLCMLVYMFSSATWALDQVGGVYQIGTGQDLADFGSPDKPRGLSIQPCKSEKEEPYIRHSSQGRSECLYLRIE